MSSLPKPPFLVKSLYPYESDHPDDLAFQEGQTIRVDVIEDEDWFTGSFADDDSGKSGMFPRNFVEVVPSKTMGRRPPPVPPSAAATASAPTASEVQDEPLQKPSAASVEREPEPEPAVEKEDVSQKLEHMSISDKREVQQPSKESIEESEPSKEPEHVKEAEPESVRETEPEVEAPKPKKKSAFQDRIAAFNNQNDAPPTPLFQQPKPRSFVNKPYVPPPSSYVPTAPKSPPPTGVNKTAPPPPPPQETESTATRDDSKEEAEESVPKMSLKDRIKMLEQQQKEEQERMEAAAAKKKQKAKAKKEAAEQQEQGGDLPEVERTLTGHSDTSQPRRSSSIDEPRRTSLEEHPADAPETVHEEQEQEQLQQPPQPPHQPPPTGEERADRQEEDEDAEEEDEDESSEEEDEEEAKRIALRERMAKISGGMGMNLGMILPGAGLPSASKPKTKKKKHIEAEGENREIREGENEETPVPQPAAVPVMPFADPNAIKGLGKQPPMQEDEEVEHREPEHGTSSDYEDEAEESRTIRGEQEQTRPPPPPPPRQERISISSEEGDSGTAMGMPPAGAPPVPPVAPRRRSMEESEASLPTAPPSAPPVPVKQSNEPPQLPPLDIGGHHGHHHQHVPHPVRDDVIEDELGDDERTESDDTNRRSVSGIGDNSSSKKRHSYVGGSGSIPPIPTSATSPTAAQQQMKRASTFDSPTSSRGVGSESVEEEPMSPSRAPPPPPPSAASAPQQPPPAHPTMAPRPPLHEREFSDSGITTGYDADEDTDLNATASFDEEAAPSKRMSGSGQPNRPPPPPPPAAAPPHPVGQSGEDEDLKDDAYEESDTTEDEQPSSAAEQQPTRAAPPPPPPSAGQAPLHRSSTGASRSSMDTGRNSTNISRASTDLSRAGRSSIEGGMVARDIDPELSTEWWTRPDGVPSAVANNRRDLIYEVEDSTTPKRGGRTLVVRDIYIVYHDYSQTVLTARYEQHDPVNTLSIEQEHTPAPSLRQDQLEDFYRKFGPVVLDTAQKLSTQTFSSQGEFVPAVLKQVPGVLPPVGTRAFGAPIYTNLANASVRQFDEIRPGDIVAFRNAKFQGHKGGLHQKYSTEAGRGDTIHVGIVYEWDGTKKKVRVYEQHQEKANKVRQEGYRLNDLKSGEVKAFRVVGRNYVGWD